MSTANRLRSWDVEYLLPYPALPSAKPDVRARGYYLHREVVMASSAGEVVRELSLRGAVPVDVSAAREPHPMFQRVTAAYREQFLLGLQFGVEAGSSPGRALEQVVEQETGPLRGRLNVGLDVLRRGRTFAEAFAALRLYDGAIVAIIEAGEETGRMVESLRSASLHLAKSAGLNKLMFAAMTVLAIDWFLALTSIIGTRYGMIPELAKQGPGKASPEEAEHFQSALALATYANDIMLWGTAAMALVVMVGTYGYLGRNEAFRSWVDTRLLRLPVVRDLLGHSAVGATAGVMATLLKGGVPFLMACVISARGSRLPSMTGYWHGARRAVEAGEPVGRALAAAPMRAHEQSMLRLHHDSGQLARCFDVIAQQRDELSKKAAKSFGIWMTVLAMLYSAVGVLIALYVVYLQNQQLLHGVGGG